MGMVFISPVTACLSKGGHVYDPCDLGICLMDHTSHIAAFVYFFIVSDKCLLNVCPCFDLVVAHHILQLLLSKKKKKEIVHSLRQDVIFLVTGLFICTLLVQDEFNEAWPQFRRTVFWWRVQLTVRMSKYKWKLII